MKNNYDCIVIGAGPAGLSTAIEAASEGARVCLLEKNEKPGQKLLISGSGRCNITHGGPFEDFLPRYGHASRFLKTALYAFSNKDLSAFFSERGCPLTEYENGKIFPRSEKAADILEVLMQEAKKETVTFCFHHGVKRIIKAEKGFTVEASNTGFQSDAVILATGGKSYPGTGSSGDGYRLAASLGHSIIDPVPALAPVYVKDYAFKNCAGISLADREIFLFRDGKKVSSHRGDILFTHRGLSGPGILDFSRHIRSGDMLKINFLTPPGPDEFNQNIIAAGRQKGKKSLKNFLAGNGIPEALSQQVLSVLMLPGEKKLAEISRSQRQALVEGLTLHPFLVESTGNFNDAMVTAGGISLKEINAKTMQSKLVRGLFFAGEVMDMDGETGGYNLQAAFSTGVLAGKSFRRIFNSSL